MRRRARTFLGATLLATALALSIPGVEVVVAAGCDANAQSCGAGARTPAPGAGAAPSCPANGANEAALAGHDAALARLRQELAAQAAAGAPLVPLNGRGYNHGPATGDPGDAVLRFEANPAPPPR